MPLDTAPLKWWVSTCATSVTSNSGKVVRGGVLRGVGAAEGSVYSAAKCWAKVSAGMVAEGAGRLFTHAQNFLG